MSARRGALAAVAGVAAVLVVAPGQSGGFGTVSTVGQRNEHERITRAALACTAAAPPGRCFDARSILSLAGGPGAFGGVGSPDSDEIFTPAAHCDDADFLGVPNYKQTRAQATAQLIACRTHLQARYRQAVTAAAGMLDDEHRIVATEVDLAKACTFTGEFGGRAKCAVLEGLGRDLHGTEDFYSHSNWADQAGPGATTPSNPPGLADAGLPEFFELRAAAPAQPIPPDLATGCFSVVPFACRGRVDHGSLNKDTGLVDPATGATNDPTTPRGRVGTNFNRAVQGAIQEARRQWEDLAAELEEKYGPTDGKLMICAITHDDPVSACTGRRIALVIDSAGADPLARRIGAARAFNRRLISAAEAGGGRRADMSAVIDAGAPAQVVSQLGDPAAAGFDALQPQGAPALGEGVRLALDELTGDPNADAQLSGVVVFTDTLAGADVAPQLARAQQLGIRVNVGLLETPPRAAIARRAQDAPEPPDPLVAAVLATGGTFAVLDSDRAERAFLDEVAHDGATNAEDPNGAADGGALERGIEAFAAETPGDAPEHWSYRTRPGTPLVVTVDDGEALDARLFDVRTDRTLDRARTSAAGRARLTGRTLSGEVELDVSGSAGRGDYGVQVDEPMRHLRGGRRSDRLRCGRRTTYVSARAGADVVTCHAGDDTLDGGRGADRLRAGPGDDVFLVRRRDLRRGTERLSGGRGRDVALFLFDRPPGTRCRRGTTARVPLGARTAFALRGIERARFGYRACAAPVPDERLPRLHDPGFSPAVEPPEPTARVERSGDLKLLVTVRVAEPTSVLAAGTASARGRTFDLPEETLDAGAPGAHRLTLTLPARLKRASTVNVRVTVVAGGVREGPTRRDTVKARLRR